VQTESPKSIQWCAVGRIVLVIVIVIDLDVIHSADYLFDIGPTSIQYTLESREFWEDLGSRIRGFSISNPSLWSLTNADKAFFGHSTQA